MVIRTDNGRFIVHEIDQDTIRSQPIQPGTRVSVVTSASDTEPAPIALAIDVLPPRQGLAAQASDPVPAEVRQLEAQIERQVRRYRIGVNGGGALDPELLSIGAFATFDPVFNQRVAFRPNAELAFGELTTLIGLHLDVLYTLPGVSRTARWRPYIGAGPNFSFSHRGIDDGDIDEDLDEGDSRFDFEEFDWDSGFNFIVGARTPNGMFFEMKATAYGAANIRMLAGVEF
jgi:hypothetical protein